MVYLKGCAQGASAFAVYAALSILIFGLPVIRALSQVYIGGGTDPICHIWAIAWWPYAIAHRLNPLITHALWAPAGYNLVWGTDIPGPILLFFPITRIFGAVVSYNLLCLLAPAANAASGFLLCRYACERFWPALVGGYIFGFSPYVICHMLGHLVLILIFLIPFAAYITLLRLKTRIGRPGFVTALFLVLLFQFLSSTEIFATATVLGGSALILAYMLADGESRTNLISVAKEAAFAYAVLTVVAIPYLYFVFAPGLPTPPNSATFYSNYLLSFVVPPPVLLFGPHSVGFISEKFLKVAPWWEQAGYLGPGLLTIMLLFAWSYWRTVAGKFLILSFALVVIMSLGPALHTGIKPRMPMPWRFFHMLPLLDEVLPGRLGMYMYLIVAVCAAIYLARTPLPIWLRILGAGLSLLFIAPNFSIWRHVGWFAPLLGTPGLTKIHVPDFFSSGQYRQYLARGDNVLMLPLGLGGSNAGMLWQAQSDFYFNTTDWFGAVAPPDSGRWPIIKAFHSSTTIIDFREQLQGFLGGHQVKAIILDSATPGRWPSILSDAGMTSVSVGGVLFYRVPGAVLALFRGATAHQMAEKHASALFTALVCAARKYVDAGYPLSELTLNQVQHLKLFTLPDDQGGTGKRDSIWGHNFWIGSRDGRIDLGIAGNYEDLQFLIGKYGPDAVRVFFPFPKPLSERGKHGNGILLISFTPGGVRQAANKANHQQGAQTTDTGNSVVVRP